MNTFPATLRTPRQTVFEGPVQACFVRAVDGDLGILAGHEPVVTALPPGRVRLKTAGGERLFVTGDAALDVAGGSLRVLAEFLVPVASAREAREQLQRYRQWLAYAHTQSRQA
jgi:F-type H+-transporting ATPase subunit epsilon